MQIGRVARQTGLSVDAVRFYERRGLLPRTVRSPGGFRLYGATDLDTLRFIGRGQRLGFSLEEIRVLLRLRGAGGHACSTVRDRLTRKLGAVRSKLRELAALEQELLRARRLCDRQLRRRGRRCRVCPVLAGEKLDRSKP